MTSFKANSTDCTFRRKRDIIAYNRTMKKLQRTIVLLKTKPTDFQAEGYAAEAALRHFDSVSFTFGLADTLPSDLNEDTAKLLSDLKRDAGPDAVYLIIHTKE